MSSSFGNFQKSSPSKQLPPVRFKTLPKPSASHINDTAFSTPAHGRPSSITSQQQSPLHFPMSRFSNIPLSPINPTSVRLTPNHRTVPLEVSAVASATNAFRNPSTRSICKRYSIDLTEPACITQYSPKKDCINIHKMAIFPEIPSTDTAFSMQKQVLPPINTEKQSDKVTPRKDSLINENTNKSSSNNERDIVRENENVKYKVFIRKTSFSKVYIKVPINESNVGNLMESDLCTCDHIKEIEKDIKQSIDDIDGMNNRKLSKTPSLPSIPEAEIINHVSTTVSSILVDHKDDSDTDSMANNVGSSDDDDDDDDDGGVTFSPVMDDNDFTGTRKEQEDVTDSSMLYELEDK